MKEWPKGKVLGFGNSPPERPLEKVKDGRVLFEECIKKNQRKDELVESLMELLQTRKK